MSEKQKMNAGYKPAHLHCRHCAGSYLLNNLQTCDCCGSPEECAHLGNSLHTLDPISAAGLQARLSR